MNLFNVTSVFQQTLLAICCSRDTYSFDDDSYSGAILKLQMQKSIKFVKNIHLRTNLLNLLNCKQN